MVCKMFFYRRTDVHAGGKSFVQFPLESYALQWDVFHWHKFPNISVFLLHVPGELNCWHVWAYRLYRPFAVHPPLLLFVYGFHIHGSPFESAPEQDDFSLMIGHNIVVGFVPPK